MAEEQKTPATFDVTSYISKLSTDVQNGVISVDDANRIQAMAKNLANKGNLGAGDRRYLRQAMAIAKQNMAKTKPPGTDGGTGGGTTDGGTGGDDSTGGDDTPYSARASAREFLRDLFGQLGFESADVNSLMNEVEGWIGSGLADVGNEAILAKFRGTKIYQNRFQGMEALRKRGQAITEAEYVQMERSYRRVLSSYGLPKEFYDNYDDYAKFIENDISAQELDDRVSAAQNMLQGNRAALDELSDYYNVGEGQALSYLLDPTKAQDVIRRQVRAAQLGGAGERSGFGMDRTQSEMLSQTSLGQTLDPFNPQTQAQLDATFARARRTAKRETTLAGIDREDYDQYSAVKAEFGDETSSLASERRAKRERARFSGTAGAARSALSQSKNL